MKKEKLAAMIDHTSLGVDATKAEIKAKCKQAKEYNFASVCVNPCYISLVKEELKDSSVKVCTVISFPLGNSTTETKVFATRNAIKRGAEEIDMVANIGAIKSKAWQIVKEDIEAVVKEAKDKAIVKVIIETSVLDDKEKKKVSKLAKQAGADFVKTSTGFAKAGAKVEDVKLMREVVGEKMGVKASGGISSKEDAEAMIAAGATRIGASSGVEIISGEQADNDY